MKLSEVKFTNAIMVPGGAAEARVRAKANNVDIEVDDARTTVTIRSKDGRTKLVPWAQVVESEAVPEPAVLPSVSEPLGPPMAKPERFDIQANFDPELPGPRIVQKTREELEATFPPLATRRGRPPSVPK